MIRHCLILMKKLMSLRKLMRGTQFRELMNSLLERNEKDNNCKNNKKKNRRKPKKRRPTQRNRREKRLEDRLLKLIKQKFKKNFTFKEL